MKYILLFLCFTFLNGQDNKQKLSQKLNDTVKLCPKIFNLYKKYLIARLSISHSRFNPKRVSEKIRILLEQEVNYEDLKHLEQKLAKVYAKKYTAKQIKDAIDFYNSPLGKKFTKVQEKIRKIHFDKLLSERFYELEFDFRIKIKLALDEQIL